MSELGKCEAWTRSGNECSRRASMVMWHPDAPPASEGATMRMCSQHINSHSLAGWKPWPLTVRDAD